MGKNKQVTYAPDGVVGTKEGHTGLVLLDHRVVLWNKPYNKQVDLYGFKRPKARLMSLTLSGIRPLWGTPMWHNPFTGECVLEGELKKLKDVPAFAAPAPGFVTPLVLAGMEQQVYQQAVQVLSSFGEFAVNTNRDQAFPHRLITDTSSGHTMTTNLWDKEVSFAKKKGKCDD